MFLLEHLGDYFTEYKVETFFSQCTCKREFHSVLQNTSNKFE